MAEHTPLVLLLENSVLLSFGCYKNDKNSLKIAFTILHQNRWYEELDMPASQFKVWISKLIVKYQKMNEVDLYKHFKYNSELIKRDIASHYYVEYTKFLESIVALDGKDLDNQFITYHYEIFPFVKVKNETPMLGLSYEVFFEYIEALIIYAASDNADFNLHQNETMMIMNEIKSYIRYRPVPDAIPSDMFFAILEVAKAKSKNHITTRFEGIVKSNLKRMNDEQDAYFLEKLKELQQSDGKYSTQEKLFDAIIETGKAKVAPFEAKEKQAKVLLDTLLLMTNPFRSYNDARPEFKALIPQRPEEASRFLWKSIAGRMLGIYGQHHVMEINKKNLYYLFTLKELSMDIFDYLVALIEVIPFAGVINWDRDTEEKFMMILLSIYRYYELKQ